MFKLMDKKIFTILCPIFLFTSANVSANRETDNILDKLAIIQIAAFLMPSQKHILYVFF